MFHLYGPVPLGSVSHVSRDFETKLTTAVLARHWTLLVGPRQHGKTTGLVRLHDDLQQLGFLSAMVDLQATPPELTYEGFLQWFTESVRHYFHSGPLEVPPEGPRAPIGRWLSLNIPEGDTPIVVIIDEAGTIPNDERRNSFYGQIRAIAGQRALASTTDLAARIIFVFSGTFRPESMVDEANSPFNVCERIPTDDLTVGQANSLWTAATTEPDLNLVEHIFQRVGGQPYLLQKVMVGSTGSTTAERIAKADDQLASLQRGLDPHVSALFERIRSDENLVNAVRQLVADGSIINQPANHDLQYLQILGLLRRDGSNLIFRNRLYADVAGGDADFLVPPRYRMF